MEYKIVLEKFEGPLDLLYHLIRKNKVDIYDIPIAKITEQYIKYIEKMKELDLDIASEFLLMVATLLEIKSKMLLPTKGDEDDEYDNDEETDPRKELVRRLLEYKKFKTAAEQLKLKKDLQSKIFIKPKEEIEDFISNDLPKLEGVQLKDLISTFSQLMKKHLMLDENFSIKEIERDEITLEEAINNLLNIFSNNKKIRLNDLFQSNYSKMKIIVTFLSVLELIKLNIITFTQDNNFGDIILIKKYTKDI